MKLTTLEDNFSQSKEKSMNNSPCTMSDYSSGLSGQGLGSVALVTTSVVGVLATTMTSVIVFNSHNTWKGKKGATKYVIPAAASLAVGLACSLVSGLVVKAAYDA